MQIKNSIFCDNQKVEATHMFINRWMDKQNAVDRYHGLLFILIKEILRPATAWMNL